MKNSFETLTTLQELDVKREELKAKRNTWLFVYFLIPALIIFLTLFSGVIQLAIISAVISISASFALYKYNFKTPFRYLTEQVKSALLGEFMRIYHPSILHEYIGTDHLAEPIVESSGLISADRYIEEDVITGIKGNTRFYLSEVDLQERYKTKNGSSYRSIFKGLLFKINLKGRSFPKSQLYSQPNMFKKWFGSINKNEDYGFWYETQNSSKFHKEMQSLFPFIRHLSKKGEVRISAQGDTITILMESNMKFLDDPEFFINRSFENENYYAKMSQQMNSLLFIIDSFTDELTPIEIEEELKLRVIEYADKNHAN